MMNSVSLAGRLADIPKASVSINGKVISKFTICINNKYTKVIDFIDCVAWGDVANEINETFKKGDLIYVVGKLSSQIKLIENEGKNNVVTVWVREYDGKKYKPKQIENEQTEFEEKTEEDKE